MEPILFLFCLTLHNAEEALWLPKWQEKTMPKRNQAPNHHAHFIFAVIGITLIGYLSAGLFLLFPNFALFEYCYIGFVGAMLLNVFLPHLALTLRFRQYCPGTLTGGFLILPVHTLILLQAIRTHLTWGEVVVPTLIVSVILLGCIPLFKKLGSRLLKNILS